MTSSIDKVNNSIATPKNQASESSYLNTFLNTGVRTLGAINDFNLRKLQIKSLEQQHFVAGASIPVTPNNHNSNTPGFFTTKHIEYIGLGLLVLLVATVALKGK